HFRFRVTGDGMTPLQRTAAASSRQQQIPSIPAGRNRVVEVRAYAGEPDLGGRVVSVGRSLPFEVPKVVPLAGQEPGRINVFLRRVNSWTPTSVSVSASTCSRPITARAGHTATLLQDGRVLIAGGYQLSNGVPVALAKAELYDPASGAFSDAPDLGLTNADNDFTPTPRAYHSANLLPDGRVLLAGGEDYDGEGTPRPLRGALVYDPVSRYYGGFYLSLPRSRHGSASEPGGRVLLLGGVSAGGSLVGPMEWFDPTTARSAVTTETYPRTGMAVAPVRGGELIASAGGTDGSMAFDDIRFFAFDGSTFSSRPNTVRMRDRRRQAALAPFGDGSRLVVVGGFTDAEDSLETTAVAGSDLVSTEGTFRSDPGPAFNARGEVCTATLPDGRVLSVGGRVAEEFSGFRSDDSSEVLTVLPNDVVTLGAPPIPFGRYRHTCTTLPDGTVLVVGGVRDTGNLPEVIGDAQIFTPVPVD
ncbi:MAG TPA: kelch repeat-containing protein, partial [Myxococcaceae bacterium]|nr:kelch repeat-containing protein [Myxococcaceae bacterium]